MLIPLRRLIVVSENKSGNKFTTMNAAATISLLMAYPSYLLHDRACAMVFFFLRFHATNFPPVRQIQVKDATENRVLAKYRAQRHANRPNSILSVKLSLFFTLVIHIRIARA